jgi:hypothetical protein
MNSQSIQCAISPLWSPTNTMAGLQFPIDDLAGKHHIVHDYEMDALPNPAELKLVKCPVQAAWSAGTSITSPRHPGEMLVMRN